MISLDLKHHNEPKCHSETNLSGEIEKVLVAIEERCTI